MQLLAILTLVMKHLPFPDKTALLRIKPALLSVLDIITCRMPDEGRLLRSGDGALKNAVELCPMDYEAPLEFLRRNIDNQSHLDYYSSKPSDWNGERIDAPRM